MRDRFTRPIFGPFRRRTRTGVPADHFPKAREMFGHGDGTTVLVADGESETVIRAALGGILDAVGAQLAAGAHADALATIAAADPLADRLLNVLGGSDGDPPPEPLARLTGYRKELGLAPAFEQWWFPDEAARDTATGMTAEPSRFWHGAPGDRTALAELLQAAGGTLEEIDGGVSTSAATGLCALELLAADPAPDPDLAHEKMTGPHSHQHAHGDGTSHQHGHFHNDSNVHNHAHGASALSKLGEWERRQIDGANEITDPAVLEAMVASAFDKLGGLEALAAKRGLTAATLPDGTVDPASWHAYLTWEGLRTDDNREFPLGCFRYADFPLSIRLLLEDDGGHWGAVTCGRIDSIEPRDVGALRAHYGEGVFGSDPNGQLAELMVEEQTQRFVSVDMRAIVCEYIEVVVNKTPAMGVLDDDDYDSGPVMDAWLRYLEATIGAATIVPMPAMPQAVIALEGVELPDAPAANATMPPGLEDYQVDEEDTGLAASAAAGGGPALPPAEWFDDPGFHVGDPRLVLQSDNKSFACPLTVGDPDPDTGLRPVYGHVAWWNCDHTAFPGKHVKPPKSASGYAYYLTGQGVDCRGGKTVQGVGNVTMGCGHAATFKVVGGRKVAVGAQEAIAHYDGGYGAVQAATVRAGQDDFGPWIAGFIHSDITDEQVVKLKTLNLSGDWREIGGQLDMIAVLAVPVPGFPIRRQLTAAGAPVEDSSTMHAAIKDDRVLALVAAGVVRRVDPLERIAHLERAQALTIDRLNRTEEIARRLLRERAAARHGL